MLTFDQHQSFGPGYGQGMQNSLTAIIIPFFLLLASISAQNVVITITRTGPPTIITSSPSSTPPSPQYTDTGVFESAVLNSTNTYRRQHNASDLTWNDTLASYAEEHVSACQFAHTHGPYGENLAQGYSDITSSIDGWGDERSIYDFEDGQFDASTGHFTQLVWKNTTSTGCGAKSCGDSGWLLFCEYSPAGNVIGQFKDEVQKELPGGDGGKSTGTPSSSSTSTPSGSQPKPTQSKAPPKGKLYGYVKHLQTKFGDAEKLNIDRYIWIGVITLMLLQTLP